MKYEGFGPSGSQFGIFTMEFKDFLSSIIVKS